VEGTATVSSSKTKQAAEREKFLLDEIARASEKLLCKQPRSPRFHAFALFLVLKFLVICAGTRIDAREEGERVRNRLNSLCDIAAQAPSFWSERPKGYVLALSQDRVEQVSEFVESCHAALAMVHDALFPLNPTPQGLALLMRRFCRVKAVHDFIREQLIARAKAPWRSCEPIIPELT